MLALVEITYWHWIGFIACVLVLLALDLAIFHRRPHSISFKEALLWIGIWFCLAMLFAAGLKPLRGPKEALEFLTGYLIELSLSMDNVFIIALIFGYFAIPAALQHRVLFWGILGALVMRGILIGLGIALVSMVHWVLYIFGAFLIFTGAKMLLVPARVDPEKNRMLLWTRKVFPVTPQLDGQKFLTHWQGGMALTPLALVLVMVETTDLIFAVDSIPAVFAVTTKPFIVFTSNVFAILGLRSLYFVLAGALHSFRYFKAGISVVLVFFGLKMLLARHVVIPISASLMLVGTILLASILLSLIVARREKK